MIGQTISHYRILEKLGGGGMGVVYKALDLKLDRPVALKFLPPELSLDPDAKERFVHEAKAASALQHHNICTVHDIDDQEGGRMFIVMDSYDGETLKARIAKSRLRSEEAIEIATQIAQGLAEAHAHGIVHRDVKPANVVVTKSGVVKILDFGLAKLSTATKLTKTGSTLGTVAYMAPEQLQGGEVDARADIFSLGVVLYEMLTGKTPFRGDHEAALMYSILNEEPEPLPNNLPDVTPEVLHIVSRALEKDRTNRYRSMEDMLIDLMRARRETSQVSLPVFGTLRRATPRVRALVAATAFFVIAAGAISLYLFNRPDRLPKINPNSTIKIVDVPVKSMESQCLSRDGNWIAYSGLNPDRTWDIYHMNSSGGLSQRVTFESAQSAWVNDYSRDGSSILFSTVKAGRWDVMSVPSLGGPVRLIAENANLAFYLPKSDRILFLKEGFIAQPIRNKPFEVWSIKKDGTDARLEYTDTGRSIEASGVNVGMSASPDGGSIVWIKTWSDFAQDIVTIDLSSKKENRLTFSKTPKGEVYWTSNNHIIYSACANGTYDLWICPAEGGTSLQLTRSRGDELNASLSDDYTKMLYFERNWASHLSVMDIETGEVSPVTSDDLHRDHQAISPEGRYIAFSLVPSYANWLTYRGLQILDVTGKEAVRYLCPQERLHQKAWSPDGRWIAFSGPPDTAGGKLKISIISPFDGTPPRLVAEAAGYPEQNLFLRWVTPDTLSWFAGEKTWLSSVHTPHPQQFYEDSTRALYFPGKPYVLFMDIRSGRQGWWIDSPDDPRRSVASSVRRLSDRVLAVAPTGSFYLTSRNPGELIRISLSTGTVIPVSKAWRPGVRISAMTHDGRKALLSELVVNSKLMLWQNPFVQE